MAGVRSSLRKMEIGENAELDQYHLFIRKCLHSLLRYTAQKIEILFGEF